MLGDSMSEIICPTDVNFVIKLALQNVSVVHVIIFYLPAMLRIALQAGLI